MKKKKNLNGTGNRTLNVKDMLYFWCKIVKLTSANNERNELSNMLDFKLISTCHVHRCRIKTIILYFYVTCYTSNYTYMFISRLLRFTIIGRGFFFWGGGGGLLVFWFPYSFSFFCFFAFVFVVFVFWLFVVVFLGVFFGGGVGG